MRSVFVVSSALPHTPFTGPPPRGSAPRTAHCGGNQALTTTGIPFRAVVRAISIAAFTRGSSCAVSRDAGSATLSGCQLRHGISTRAHATRMFARL